MKGIILGLVSLSLLMGCSSQPNLVNFAPVEDSVSQNPVISSTNKTFMFRNDISEFFPKVSNKYEMHYTVFKNKQICQGVTCGVQFPSGFSTDDGNVKIEKMLNNKVQASFKIKNENINKIYPINETENVFWQKLSETIINFHLEEKNPVNRKITWSVADSDRLIKIRAYPDFDSPYYEEYLVREIRAKISGIDQEAVFQISKEFGIITFYFQEKHHTNSQITFKNTIIGKFVKDPTNPNHPINP